MNGVISIAILKIDVSQALVHIIGPEGQVINDSMTLPWQDPLDWTAVFTALECPDRKVKTRLNGAQLQRAIQLGLVDTNGYFTEDRLKKVGEQLYQALLAGGSAMSSLENYLAGGGKAQADQRMLVQLHLGDNGSRLHAYPWELLYSEKGQRFFFNTGSAQITRSIDFNAPYPSFPDSDNLNILIVDPRPDIPGDIVLEQVDRSVLNEVKDTRVGDLQIHDLSEEEGTTLSRLHAFFKRWSKSKQAFILHIDTHGSYGWHCAHCNHVKPPGVEVCDCEKSPKEKPAQKPPSQGYLALDDGKGKVVWVHGEWLAKILKGCSIQLVVLSACKSGLMGGTSPFNSIAGALVQAGIPAVVAFQSSIKVDAAKSFTQGMYSEWMEEDTDLVDCLAEARIMMSANGRDDEDWFRPVLYMRSDPANPRGKITKRRTGFRRDDAFSEIRKALVKYRPGENQFRVRNFYALDGAGKTSILLTAGSALRKDYLIVYVPLKQYIEVGKEGTQFYLAELQSDLFNEIRVRLSDRAGKEIPAATVRSSAEQMAKQLEALVEHAEKAGHSARLLIDDLDLLRNDDTQNDIKRFVDFVLKPLVPYAQVIVTSGQPFYQYLKRNLSIPVEGYMLQPLSMGDVQEHLPPERQSDADEILKDAAGFPGLARNMVNQIKDAAFERRVEGPRPDEEIMREIIDEQQPPVETATTAPGIQIKTILAVLRWFNLNMMKSILPKLLTDEKQEYSEQHYLKLIQDLGGQVEWKNKGIGGWRIQPQFKKLACQLIQQENPAEYRRIHQVAYDAYHDLLMQDKQQRKPDIIIEMVYHKLELFRLDSAKDGYEYSRFKNVSITQELVTEVLESIFQDLGKTDTLFMEETNALLRLDEDIRNSLPEDFIYRPKNS